jgi:hypothetical protein
MQLIQAVPVGVIMAIEETTELVAIPNTEEKKKFLEHNRYLLSKIYKRGGVKFFETWDIPEIPESSEDSLHRISSGEEGRWDLISYKYYRTVMYWWVICSANSIKNPLQVLPVDTIIRIPSMKTLYDISLGKLALMNSGSYNTQPVVMER